MKIIICGAGEVGFSIARHLSAEDNDVTIIDQSEDLVRKMTNNLEVQGVVGFASHPDVLKQAGASEADMLVAVTASDEVNMVACQLGHSLFKVPTKIARVREQHYLKPEWSDLFSPENMPIDHIISPEIEVANAINRRLEVPGAFNSISLFEDQIKIIGILIDNNCPLINTPLEQIKTTFSEFNIVVISISRGGKLILPKPDEQIFPDDEIYFLVKAQELTRAMKAFGYDQNAARKIVIAGGGNIGLHLAQIIQEKFSDTNLKLIEMDEACADHAAKTLSKGIVLKGDALDPDVLNEAHIADAETIISVTNEEEVNILCSLLAKRYGCQRAVTLINTITYKSLITDLGIDVVVDPRAITVSSVMRHVRRGKIRSIYSLGEGVGEIIDLEALETAPIIGQGIKDIKFPKGVIVGAIVREKNVVMPDQEITIKANDRLVLFAPANTIKKLEKLFSVRLEFF
jgi:trk system potassium uptake protein TrkA